MLPPDRKTQLDQLNRVRAVHGTTALEGNPLSEAEVRHQMDLLASEAAPPSGPSRDQQQVLNAGRAQDWIRQRFTPESPPLRRADILQMHELITAGSDETNNVPGRLRTHPVVVGTEALGGVHRGAPPQEVSSLVDRFVGFVNSRPFLANHPVVRALLAHFFLVTIHPFGDGNGRVSRLVEAGILLPLIRNEARPDALRLARERSRVGQGRPRGCQAERCAPSGSCCVRWRRRRATQLGPTATQAAVREAARLCEGCSRPDAGYETPVQRWQRERHARGTAEDLRDSHP